MEMKEIRYILNWDMEEGPFREKLFILRDSIPSNIGGYFINIGGYFRIVYFF